MPTRKLRGLGIFVSCLVTVIMIVVLVQWGNLNRSARLLERSHWAGLALGFALFLFGNLLKTERFRRVTPVLRTLPYGELFGIVCVYNLLTTVLPSALGELSYPALLKLRHRTDLITGAVAVLVTRTLDVLSIATCGAVALINLTSLSGKSWPRLIPVTMLILLLVMEGFLLASISDRASQWPRQLRFAPRFLSTLVNFGQRLRVEILSSISAKQIGELLFFTVGVSSCGYVVCWWVAHSIHVPLSGMETMLSFSLALLLSAMPFKGLLGLGTQQAGWVLGLSLTGWSAQAAFDLGVSMHLILLSYTLLLGVIGGSILMACSSLGAVENKL